MKKLRGDNFKLVVLLVWLWIFYGLNLLFINVGVWLFESLVKIVVFCFRYKIFSMIEDKVLGGLS